jgi:hypothetical protein
VGNYRVRVLDGVPVDQIVTGTQSAICEPSHVAMGKGAGPDRVEILVPGNEVSSEFSPEFVRILNGFLVHGLILLQSVDMRLRLVIPKMRMIKLFRIRGFNNNLSSVSEKVSSERKRRGRST